jgi:hypothetical protein
MMTAIPASDYQRWQESFSLFFRMRGSAFPQERAAHL